MNTSAFPFHQMRLARNNVWRFKRIAAQARDVYVRHGSVLRSGRYLYRYAVKKIPLFWEHYRMSKNVAQLSDSIQAKMDQDGAIPRFAIKITGGIGDYVIIARFLRDMLAVSEEFRFDVYCTQIVAANWVFASIPQFEECYSEFLFDKFRDMYPVALRISQFVLIHENDADWQRVRHMARFVARVEKIIRFRPKIETFIQNHPFMDGYLGQKIVFMNMNRNNFLHGMAGIEYSSHKFDLATDPGALTKHGLAGRKYVTVHNGFDTGFIISGKQATKCYPHFPALVAALKQRFPDACVVQVGSSTSIPIPGVDVQLINRSSLTEVAEIIKHSLLHLDNEGGLVHIASCLGTKSCVIFGPTSADYFSYEDNFNIRPLHCGGCWWVNDTWMDNCPRGFEKPICLSEQNPKDILAAVTPYLTEQLAAPINPGSVQPTGQPAGTPPSGGKIAAHVVVS